MAVAVVVVVVEGVESLPGQGPRPGVSVGDERLRNKVGRERARQVRPARGAPAVEPPPRRAAAPTARQPAVAVRILVDCVCVCVTATHQSIRRARHGS